MGYYLEKIGGELRYFSPYMNGVAEKMGINPRTIVRFYSKKENKGAEMIKNGWRLVECIEIKRENNKK